MTMYHRAEIMKPVAPALDAACMEFLTVVADAQEAMSAALSTRAVWKRLGWMCATSDNVRERFYDVANRLEMLGLISIRRINDHTSWVELMADGWEALGRIPPIWMTPRASTKGLASSDPAPRVSVAFGAPSIRITAKAKADGFGAQDEEAMAERMRRLARSEGHMKRLPEAHGNAAADRIVERRKHVEKMMGAGFSASDMAGILGVCDAVIETDIRCIRRLA